MMIVTAVNTTAEKDDSKVLARADGTSTYDVWVGINRHKLWSGEIKNHIRNEGAPALLRHIAEQMEIAQEMEAVMPIMTRFLQDMAEPSDQLLEQCRLDLAILLRRGSIRAQKGRTHEASLRRKIKRLVAERIKRNGKAANSGTADNSKRR